MRIVLGWCRACAVRLASRLRVRRHWRLYLVLLCALLFLHFIWPTPYVYRTQKTEWGDFIRVNRITQTVSVLRKGRWVSIRSLERKVEQDKKEKVRQDALRALPASELPKVTVTAMELWRSSRPFHVTALVHNGTDKPLAEVAIDVSVHEKYGASEPMVYTMDFDGLWPAISPGAQRKEYIGIDHYVRFDANTQTYSVRLRAARWAKENK